MAGCALSIIRSRACCCRTRPPHDQRPCRPAGPEYFSFASISNYLSTSSSQGALPLPMQWPRICRVSRVSSSALGWLGRFFGSDTTRLWWIQPRQPRCNTLTQTFVRECHKTHICICPLRMRTGPRSRNPACLDMALPIPIDPRFTNKANRRQLGDSGYQSSAWMTRRGPRIQPQSCRHDETIQYRSRAVSRQGATATHTGSEEDRAGIYLTQALLYRRV